MISSLRFCVVLLFISSHLNSSSCDPIVRGLRLSPLPMIVSFVQEYLSRLFGVPRGNRTHWLPSHNFVPSAQKTGVGTEDIIDPPPNQRRSISVTVDDSNVILPWQGVRPIHHVVTMSSGDSTSLRLPCVGVCSRACLKLKFGGPTRTRTEKEGLKVPYDTISSWTHISFSITTHESTNLQNVVVLCAVKFTWFTSFHFTSP